MATDIKKFLDQAGVSTLWSRVAEEVAKVDAKAVKNAEDIVAHGTRLDTAEAKIAALEAGTYDDTELRGLIGDNASAIADNVAALAILNGDAATTGSVANTANAAAAAKVAEIVANADANFDTLKEIADWILNDTTGAADMANDIAALQGLVGDKAVAEQIAEAISAEGLDKYALAADLTSLVGRVKVLEDAGYQNAEAVAAAIDAKITALDLTNAYDAKGAAAAAETAAKAYADGLAVNYDAAGSAQQAFERARDYAESRFMLAAESKNIYETIAGNFASAKGHSDANLVTAKAYSDANLATAKAYTDTEMAKVQSLTTAEIDAAIASAKAQV